MTLCPCGSAIDYFSCCKMYLEDGKLPATPELLMRSRYTAYSQANINYIKKTMRGKPLIGFDETVALTWAKRVVWLRLQVMNSFNETPDKGYVEFIASFIEGGKLNSFHEVSEFNYLEGKWFYVDGINQPGENLPKNSKIHRNSPCPCGSLKKFKNCHDKK